MNSASAPRPVILCILDGWGELANGPANAIERARKPVWDRLIATCPHGAIQASEENVGLPDGQMGNSEVGHMNLGAGRVVLQDLPRIDKAVADGTLAHIEQLQHFIADLRHTGGTAHLMGLFSPGGVHAHQTHLAALVKILAKADLPVAVHAFLDGRDMPPQSALDCLARFEADLGSLGGFRIATISGRYFAMDRDNRWDRVARAYDAIVAARGETARDARSAIEASYARNVGDEFVLPTVIGDYAGMADGDGVLMANFRADRTREILTALLDPAFDGFLRSRVPCFSAALGMVEYSTELAARMGAIFGPELPDETLGQLVSEAGLRQLRIAETEKYPHVTYFFNGGDERVFDGEERILVPSPKVATYDLKPEMSAGEVTDRLVEAIGSGRFDLIVANYANADMVGHTGFIEPAIKAIETIDQCLGRVVDALEKAGGAMVITADHGNAEQMVDPETGKPHTAHTLNPVPVVLVNGPERVTGIATGKLADIAPTMLGLLGLEQPRAMTGHSLLIEKGRDVAARA